MDVISKLGETSVWRTTQGGLRLRHDDVMVHRASGSSRRIAMLTIHACRDVTPVVPLPWVAHSDSVLASR
eukprot:CAMPEP_0196659968 /NCGR_PEP_ID=MMETSP1086-20130531/37505_1 /TAXON_ID=77921 /ORGANISM="Cyanoptyche  gloeocystis , Strain SAG4.97" /LENGTH=69 /DNA_ID=CAMNT_0041994161 /DNA_START=19 /DNA_END=224 /DNA_ORIENTATION=+